MACACNLMQTQTFCRKRIPWTRVLLEKPTGLHLVKNFTEFYGTRRFITAFAKARYLSYPEPVQASPYAPFHFLKILVNIILTSTPGSSKWSLSLTCPHQNPVYTSSVSHTFHLLCPSYFHTIHFNIVTLYGRVPTCTQIWGAFLELRKVTVSCVLFVPLRPSVRPHTTRIFRNIWYLGIFRKSVKKIQVSVEYDKSNDTLQAADLCTFVISRSVLLRVKMFQTDAVDKMNTHLLCSITSPPPIVVPFVRYCGTLW